MPKAKPPRVVLRPGDQFRQLPERELQINATPKEPNPEAGLFSLELYAIRRNSPWLRESLPTASELLLTGSESPPTNSLHRRTNSLRKAISFSPRPIRRLFRAISF